MPSRLARHLLLEQGAFLRRDRRAWREHLQRARGFLGDALRDADPSRPVLILGAGWGLEVPWDRAPKGAVGWDADPLSRLGTLLRHRRWAPWVFEDLTGDLAALSAMAARCVREPWSGRRVDAEAAVRRLAGLLPSLKAEAAPLRAWIAAHRPGLILSANLAGQFGPVVQALVRRAFHPFEPFRADPEARDPLGEAVEAFVARAVRNHLEALAESGAELALLYDRAVVFGEAPVALGPWEEAWSVQLRSEGPLEASDPLAGVAPEAILGPGSAERWLWPLGPGQLHLVEARRISRR
jgi:hypothetical protein